MSKATIFPSPYYLLFGFWFVFSPLLGLSEESIFPGYEEMPEVLFVSRVVGLLSLIVSCVLYALSGKKFPLIRHATMLIIICATVRSLGMVLIALPEWGAPEYSLLVGSVLRGLPAGFAALIWIDNLSNLKPGQVGVAICEGLLGYGVVCLVFSLLNQISPWAQLAFSTVCPLAGGMGCILAAKNTVQLDISVVKPERLSRFGLFFFVLINLIYGFIFGVMADYFALPNHFVIDVLFFSVGAVMLVIFVIYGKARDYGRGYRIYAGAASIALLICTLAGGAFSDIMLVLLAAIWIIQLFFAIMVFSDVEYSMPGMRSAMGGGIALGTVSIGVLVAAVLPLHNHDSLTASTLDSSIPVVATLVSIAFFASVFLPRSDRWESVWGFSSFILPESQEDLVVRRCNEMVEKYGLTKRELEVALLLALGHRNDHISKELFISPFTTKTHIRNIYAKTDTHSLEEFMRLVTEGSIG